MRTLCTSCTRAAVTAGLVLSFGVTAALAQPAAKTASQFYMDYRAAFSKAKAVEELLPYMTRAKRTQVESTPKEQRPQMFELLKVLGAQSDIKVLKEAKAGDEWILEVTGIDSDKKTSTGTVRIVQEGGAWKVSNESWTTKG